MTLRHLGQNPDAHGMEPLATLIKILPKFFFNSRGQIDNNFKVKLTVILEVKLTII